MCGRYITVSKIGKIKKKFGVQGDIDFPPNYNVSAGDMAPVIASDQPDRLQLMEFGLTPFFAAKKLYMINARSEGKRNLDNSTNYTGAMGIIDMPSFRKPIRSQRCLVIADGFIEGTTKEKLKKPHLVYLRNKVRPFAFAGIWDHWANRETGEITGSFAIITTVANNLLSRIPHHRSPVILTDENHGKWLDPNLPLNEALAMLHPYPAALMNAYPIDPAIRPPAANGAHLLDPVGERLFPEYDLEMGQETELQGMGSTRSRKKRMEEDNRDSSARD